MKRLIPIAVAAMVLTFGVGSAAADTGEAQPNVQELGTSSSLFVTFTEGWFEREITPLRRRAKRCFKRCKHKCKRKYKRCKRAGYGKHKCKRKKRKCKSRCRRRCRRY